MFQEETLREVERGEYPEPEGEFLEVIKDGRDSITVLTRVDGDPGGGVELPFEPAGLTVTSLRDKVADAELSDAERTALIEAEQSGKDRKTAIKILTDE